MSKAQHPFKQGDVTKALKGAVKAGLSVKRIEIYREGKIVLIAAEPEPNYPEVEDVAELI
jgi:hypothetical protein